jgi:hypothetical protein
LPHIVAYVPPAEAVEAVNIVTNSFDAEQGMAGGAAINVAIKSGTNEFHGAAWEYHTNSKLKARNYFYCLYSCTGDPNRAPKNILNQFGGMLGGPLSKTNCSSLATLSAPSGGKPHLRPVRSRPQRLPRAISEDSAR